MIKTGVAKYTESTDRNDFNSVLAAHIDDTELKIMLPIVLTSDTVVPENITVNIIKGGSIDMNGYSLTFEGKVSSTSDEWIKASPDNPPIFKKRSEIRVDEFIGNDTVKLQCAINVSSKCFLKRIILSSRVYVLDSIYLGYDITNNPGFTEGNRKFGRLEIVGSGRCQYANINNGIAEGDDWENNVYGTFIHCTNLVDPFITVEKATGPFPARDITISNLAIYQNNPDFIIKYNGVHSSTLFQDVIVFQRNIAGSGVQINTSWISTVDRLEIQAYRLGNDRPEVIPNTGIGLLMKEELAGGVMTFYNLQVDGFYYGVKIGELYDPTSLIAQSTWDTLLFINCCIQKARHGMDINHNVQTIKIQGHFEGFMKSAIRLRGHSKVCNVYDSGFINYMDIEDLEGFIVIGDNYYTGNAFFREARVVNIHDNYFSFIGPSGVITHNATDLSNCINISNNSFARLDYKYYPDIALSVIPNGVYSAPVAVGEKFAITRESYNSPITDFNGNELSIAKSLHSQLDGFGKTVSGSPDITAFHCLREKNETVETQVPGQLVGRVTCNGTTTVINSLAQFNIWFTSGDEIHIDGVNYTIDTIISGTKLITTSPVPPYEGAYGKVCGSWTTDLEEGDVFEVTSEGLVYDRNVGAVAINFTRKDNSYNNYYKDHVITPNWFNPDHIMKAKYVGCKYIPVKYEDESLIYGRFIRQGYKNKITSEPVVKVRTNINSFSYYTSADIHIIKIANYSHYDVPGESLAITLINNTNNDLNLLSKQSNGGDSTGMIITNNNTPYVLKVNEAVDLLFSDDNDGTNALYSWKIKGVATIGLTIDNVEAQTPSGTIYISDKESSIIKVNNNNDVTNISPYIRGAHVYLHANASGGFTLKNNGTGMTRIRTNTGADKSIGRNDIVHIIGINGMWKEVK